MTNKMQAMGSGVGFLLIGVGIGSAVGMLFAPKSGKESREFLVGKAQEVAKETTEFARNKARDLREGAEDIACATRQAFRRVKKAEAA